MVKGRSSVAAALLTALLVMLACGSARAASAATGPTASALDPADSISVSAPTTPTGGTAITAELPFVLNGTGMTDGDDPDGGVLTVAVVTAPVASGLFAHGCPGDLVTLQAQADQGTTSAVIVAGLTTPALIEGPGAFTWSAPLNENLTPDITQPGTYDTCAYFGDYPSGDIYAVSAPSQYTVLTPANSEAPGRFGGPPGSKEPSFVTLKVRPQHSPIRAPGRNLLTVSGQFAVADAQTGVVTLTTTVIDASHYNGCAPAEDSDEQIVNADGGTILEQDERVAANGNGTFREPIALSFRRPVHQTLVVCTYLTPLPDPAIAVGYLRVRPSSPARRHR